MENNYDNFNEEAVLPGNNRKNAFALPKGYFDSLSARILNRIEHEEELKECSSLIANRKSSFKVPASYFDSLANRLEYNYELSCYPELQKTEKLKFKIPTEYFANSEKRLANKLELESELKEFSVLSSIPKKNSFKTVPSYFENAPEQAKEKVHAPTISVFQQITTILFRPQMAIAASLILIVGISALWYFNQNDTEKLTGDCMTLACLEKNEILDEKNIQNLDDESLYEMIDESALDQQLSGDEKTEDTLNTNAQ